MLKKTLAVVGCILLVTTGAMGTATNDADLDDEKIDFDNPEMDRLDSEGNGPVSGSLALNPPPEDNLLAWRSSGRIINFNEQPVQDQACTVPVDQICDSPSVHFGASLAMDDATIVVAETRADTIHLFEEDQLGWTNIATFSGPDGFGGSMVIDDDHLIVGAYQASEVHVFQRSESGWGLSEILTVPDGSCLGSSVDFDGSRILAAEFCRSMVHIFELSEDGWVETAELKVPGVILLGLNAGFSGENILASSIFQGIHEFQENETGWSSQQVLPGSLWTTAFSKDYIAYIGGGAIKIHERGPDGWEHSADIYREEASPFDGIDGFSGSIALDGDTLVLGAGRADPSPGFSGVPEAVEDPCVSEGEYEVCLPPRPGAAFVFEKIDGEWGQTAKLLGDPAGQHSFGEAVAVGKDGERISVGAPESLISSFGTTLTIDPEDSVHIFGRDGEGLV